MSICVSRGTCASPTFRTRAAPLTAAVAHCERCAGPPVHACVHILYTHNGEVLLLSTHLQSLDGHFLLPVHLVAAVSGVSIDRTLLHMVRCLCWCSWTSVQQRLHRGEAGIRGRSPGIRRGHGWTGGAAGCWHRGRHGGWRPKARLSAWALMASMERGAGALRPGRPCM